MSIIFNEPIKILNEFTLLPDEKKEIELLQEFSTFEASSNITIKDFRKIINNRIVIAEPQLKDFNELIKTGKIPEPPDDIIDCIETHNIFGICFYFTLDPTQATHHFVNSRFEIRVFIEPKKNDLEIPDQPIVLELLPARLTKEDIESGKTLGVKFSLWGANVNLGLARPTGKVEKLHLSSSGKQTSKFNWSYEKYQKMWLDGDYETLAIIKAPKEHTIKATINLSAIIQLTNGWAIPLLRPDKKEGKVKLKTTLYTPPS